jgi:LmbE family N-acetylglucosaminyl deacetylase
MDFRDSQYGPTHTDADLQRSLAGLIHLLRPAAVFAPLGLFHSDHLSVHAAALQVAVIQRDLCWVLYEDALYRRIPGLVEGRLNSLRLNGFVVTPTTFRTRAGTERKVRAVHCYRSQLRALGTKGRLGHLDALAPECYWRLTPP